MKKSKVLIICVLVVGAIGLFVWNMRPTDQQGEAAPSPEAGPGITNVRSGAAEPVAPAEAPEPETAEEPQAPAPAPTDESAVATGALTAERLRGTEWEQGKVKSEFLPDGRWSMNGRICARWEVLGDKVRIYDDEKNEEHFLDIVGDTLEFNGKKLGRLK